jgi:hypothetical protein
MLRYDGQMTDIVQTASNEDLIEIQVEDDDVDINLFQEKRNKEDEKVLSEQNSGNKRKHHGEQGEDPVRTESRKGKKKKEKKMGLIDCRKGRSICFCNGVDELIILK